ncbi:uncharacterized protein SCODWIG_00469 [Saccharomycodes ludwigii]|uniref:Association with the SNF1 complex (ASC) domain-containing protein n=2 Tax=Saccharomycodes ludwigii TaxID=36035 RepID=A0A376B201_9ASCO|nr:uncharacterized protein SCODWIG_00469 [Saccharomycodes ludwigii]
MAISPSYSATEYTTEPYYGTDKHNNTNNNNKYRKGSITSKLFPSRNTRHTYTHDNSTGAKLLDSDIIHRKLTRDSDNSAATTSTTSSSDTNKDSNLLHICDQLNHKNNNQEQLTLFKANYTLNQKDPDSEAAENPENKMTKVEHQQQQQSHFLRKLLPPLSPITTTTNTTNNHEVTNSSKLFANDYSGNSSSTTPTPRKNSNKPIPCVINKEHVSSIDHNVSLTPYLNEKSDILAPLEVLSNTIADTGMPTKEILLDEIDDDLKQNLARLSLMQHHEHVIGPINDMNEKRKSDGVPSTGTRHTSEDIGICRTFSQDTAVRSSISSTNNSNKNNDDINDGTKNNAFGNSKQSVLTDLLLSNDVGNTSKNISTDDTVKSTNSASLSKYSSLVKDERLNNKNEENKNKIHSNNEYNYECYEDDYDGVSKYLDYFDDGFLENKDIIVNNIVFEDAIKKYNNNEGTHDYDTDNEIQNVKNNSELKRKVFTGTSLCESTEKGKRVRMGSVSQDKIDSYNVACVEHKEVDSNDNATDKTKIVPIELKWKDNFVDPKTNPILYVVSEDLASVLHNKRKTRFLMNFDPKDKTWVVPGLKVPNGVYNFHFEINGEWKYSNYFPIATDFNGNFVNWFELDNNVNVNATNVEELWEEEKEKEEKGKEGGIDIVNNHTNSTLSNNNTIGKPDEVVPNWKMKWHEEYGPASMENLTRPTLHTYQSAESYHMSSINLTKRKEEEYSNTIPALFEPLIVELQNNLSSGSDVLSERTERLATGRHTLGKIDWQNVLEYTQEELFTDLQILRNIDQETAEDYFLNKLKIPDLPVYLNSSYLNELFQKEENAEQEGSVNGSRKSSFVHHIIPHVNLNHLLTNSIRDEVISVGCTTRYQGKFITQVIYSPCNYLKDM